MTEVMSRAANEADMFQSALKLMGDALELLDEVHAPADVGAYLNMAIVRLQSHQTALSGVD